MSFKKYWKENKATYKAAARIAWKASKGFSVGDKVRCSLMGDGVVVGIDDSLLYPVGVDFYGESAAYTPDGRFWEYGTVTLSLIEREE